MSDKTGISGRTGLYAVIGDPVTHSLSPCIMNSAFRHNGIDAVYVAMTVRETDAQQAMQMIRTFGLKGVNVTMPLKQAIVPWLDKLSPEAELVGAANCVINRNGVLEGHNTDCVGFRLSLGNYFPKAPKKAFILGAGGVARAVASELVRWGCGTIYLTNRHQEKAVELARILRSQGAVSIQVLGWQSPEWDEALMNTGLLINATSLGMGRKGKVETLFEWDKLSSTAVIYETVYNPLETTFVREGRRLGFQTVEGIELLLWQAVAGFELWTGTTAPVAVMKESLVSGIGSD